VALTLPIMSFQYPLSGLDRLLQPVQAGLIMAMLCFNTLCRVLIGCYVASLRSCVAACWVSIPSVGS